jgi:hypothetical protein
MSEESEQRVREREREGGEANFLNFLLYMPSLYRKTPNFFHTSY